MLEVKKTTYEVDGLIEPCFIVTDGYTEVRIAKMYHIIGADTLHLLETQGGEYNSDDEWTGNFESLTEEDALDLAKSYSVYLGRE